MSTWFIIGLMGQTASAGERDRAFYKNLGVGNNAPDPDKPAQDLNAPLVVLAGDALGGGFKGKMYSAPVEVRFNDSTRFPVTVTVSLDGGLGFQSTAWWWPKDRVTAVLEVNGKTCGPGESITLTVWEDFFGTVKSSNAVEDYRVTVTSKDLKASDSGSFLGGELEYKTTLDLSGAKVPFTVNLNHGKTVLADHRLRVIISQVELKNGKSRYAKDGGSLLTSASLTNYVKIDGPHFLTTHAAGKGSVTSTYQVVSPQVSAFYFIAVDLDVSEKPN